MSPYSQLPTHFQWVKDSFVLVASRAEDPVLSRIDSLVDALNRTKAEGESMYLYGELMFATDHWLKYFKLDPKMKAAREPAIRSLFAFACHRLAAAFHCTVATLPNELEKLYGKDLSAHGVHQDSPGVLGTQHYMQRAVANQFRVFFKQGLAYQFPWRSTKPPVLELANSEPWSKLTPDSGKQVVIEEKVGTQTVKRMVIVLNVAWAYFVMSMGRDIYMGPHMNVSGHSLGQVAKVHSSWLAGTVVQAAGSMLIEEGVVKGIRNNSGHYKPVDEYIVNVLELLRTVRVNLATVDVYNYAGNDFGLSGEEFLAERGNWDSILKRKALRQQPRTPTPPAPLTRLPVPGGKPKKKYQCMICKRIYQESYTVAFCPYCHGNCIAA